MNISKCRAVCYLLTVMCLPVFGQGTSFTYNGRLNVGGNPANGLFDLKFTLFSVISGPGTVAGPVTNSAISVADGVFTVTLDFGASFPGADRFLEIAARTNGGGAFVNLSPRQKITAVPYAITAGNLTGTVSATGLSGTYSGAVTFNNAANSFTGDGAGLTGLDGAHLTGGSVGLSQLAGNSVDSSKIVDGAIVNADISASAAIADTKLATIGTVGKVSDTALSANVARLGTPQTFTADKTFGSGAQILADIGTVSAPGYTFAGDANTGIFEPGTNVNVVALVTGGAERLRVDSAGRVGIGTAIPARELEIHHAGDTEIGLKSTDTDGHLWTLQSTAVSGNAILDASFQIIDRTAGFPRVAIGTNGNIGIGTSGPAARLHVAGGTDAALTGGGFIVTGATNGANLALDNNEIMARNNGAKSTLFLNNDGGDVSIGGASDGAFSTIYLNNPVYTEQSVKPVHDAIHSLGGSANRWFDVWALNPFIQTSDARAKKNIQPLHYGLETVLSLRPVSFQWKQAATDRENLGLIAQEVEPIVPEAVVKGEKPEDLAGMNYSAFIPILIHAVQDQQTLIDQQRVENAALKKRLDRLERQITRETGDVR